MKTTTISEQMVLAKWELLKQGQSVIVGDSWLDAAAAYFDSIDSDGTHPESQRYFRFLITRPNPSQCGLLDRYVAELRGSTVQ